MSKGDTVKPAPPSFRARWWATEDKVVVRLSTVRDFCVRCFCTLGVPEEKAVFAVESMLEKDMQGDHLRGINHVPLLCQEMEEGAVAPNPPLKVLAETSATALVDGDGFDYCIGYDAMRLCMEKAKRHGIALVGVRKQLGKLGFYMQMAVKERLIGFGTIQAPFLIAPTGGVQPLIGNNPTGFGFPTRQVLPVILDASFSRSSVTPIANAAKAGEKVPKDLVLDAEGNPTDDPRVMLSSSRQASKPAGRVYPLNLYWPPDGRGSLVPVGGYKGYAFALAFGLLTSILTGPRTPVGTPELGWHYSRPGTVFICIDPGAFGPVDEFEAALDQYLQMVTGSPRRAGVDAIAYPGLVSGQAILQHQETDTLPLTPQVLAALRQYARRRGFPLEV